MSMESRNVIDTSALIGIVRTEPDAMGEARAIEAATGDASGLTSARR
jgi:uncharacterized protein with PIN domain